MEIYQLRSFLTIVREGNYTKAAKKLFLTQPALSLQIKALEEALGEPLFEREGRKIYLTEAGRILMERAEQILSLVEQTSQEVGALHGLQAGQLAIGTNDSNCLYLLPELIQLFRQQFPGVELHLTNRHSTEVASLVAEGLVDFGLVTLPVPNPHLKSEVLFQREDVVVCSPDHPLSRQATVSLTELVQYPLLLLDQGSSSRILFDQLLAKADLVLNTIMELGSIEVIKRFVEIDLGVSIIPKFTAEQELKAGRLHAIHLDWLPPRFVGLIQRRNGYLSPAAQMFLELLKQHAPANVKGLSATARYPAEADFQPAR